MTSGHTDFRQRADGGRLPLLWTVEVETDTWLIK